MYVVVNAAMSVDGKLSTVAREQVTISGPRDFDRVDRLRADVDAVMVGIGTVLADDPSLTVDRIENTNPIRVIADSHGRTPTDAKVFDDRAETIILVSEHASPAAVDRFRSKGATVVRAGMDRVDLPRAVHHLADHGIERLLVEGGGELIFSLLEAGLVDDLSVYVGPMVIGGRDAPTLADGEGFLDPDRFPTLTLQSVERIDEGVLLQWSVEAG